jgi:hypothetical protein
MQQAVTVIDDFSEDNDDASKVATSLSAWIDSLMVIRFTQQVNVSGSSPRRTTQASVAYSWFFPSIT